jgi:5'-nucleotidase/UDP-sugar diphosphatase
MKKNKFSVLGMLALVLVLGFAFADCDNGDSNTENNFITGAAFPVTDIILVRYGETPIGDLVADSLPWYATKINKPVDFSIFNAGSIRDGLPKGIITEDDTHKVLSFDNTMVIITLSGSDVISLFDYVATMKQGQGGFAICSKEVKYTLTYDNNGENGSISNLTINNSSINTERTYDIAINDYMYGGGDGYSIFSSGTNYYDTNQYMYKILYEYGKSLDDNIMPIIDGRLTIIGGITY